jgi:hypothetical protein
VRLLSRNRTLFNDNLRWPQRLVSFVQTLPGSDSQQGRSWMKRKQ